MDRIPGQPAGAVLLILPALHVLFPQIHHRHGGGAGIPLLVVLIGLDGALSIAESQPYHQRAHHGQDQCGDQIFHSLSSKR